MTVIDDQGRPEPPLAADEATMLLAFLDYSGRRSSGKRVDSTRAGCGQASPRPP